MVRRLAQVAMALGAAAFLTSWANAADPVTVSVAQVHEVRSVDLPAFNKKVQDQLSHSIIQPVNNALFIRLEVTGKPIESAFALGKVTVSSAKIDKGDLKPRTGETGSGVYEEFVPIARMPDLEGSPPQAKDKTTLLIDFELPQREATTIVSLEGTIKLMGGKSQEVKFPGMARKTGKLADKALEGAGLSISVVKVPETSQAEPGQAMALEVTGDTNKILDVVLLNSKGEDLEAGTHLEPEKDKKTVIVLFKDSKIPVDAVLRLTVLPAPEFVDVPFKLSNIKLP